MLKSKSAGNFLRLDSELSERYERLQRVALTLDDLADQVSAAVLLEDLSVLEEECEEILVASEEIDPFHLCSLESRSKTVIEEAEEFTNSMVNLIVLRPLLRHVDHRLGTNL